MPVRSFHALVFFLVMLLAGCGNGTSVSISGLNNGASSLSVTINGLPAGVQGDVTVTGPNDFSRRVGATETLSNLAPGSYRITPGNVLSGNAVYAPTNNAVQTLVIGPGLPVGNVTVAYSQQGSLNLALQQVASGLASPTFLTAPAADARLFIVERAGRIRILQQGNLLSEPFLDISSKVSTDGERGLLSMAFHPQFVTNGFFFVYYTDPSGDIVIERYSVSSSSSNLAEPGSALRILTIPHPVYSNHNGGLLAFGPDGLLYLGTGDGGGAGDPSGNAQNTGSLLGKMLRIDVNNSNVAVPYMVPPQNPFANQTGRRREVWAYGLRNPWRFAFDPDNNLIFIADVGQDRREEIDVVSLGNAGSVQGGYNFGWNVLEGTLCFTGTQCTRNGVTLPVLEYDHNNGCSITGGFVYRGTAIPELQGRYFYSDYCNGGLRSMVYRGGVAAEQVNWPVESVGQIPSFGQDAQKELYMLSASGRVYKLVRR